ETAESSENPEEPSDSWALGGFLVVPAKQPIYQQQPQQQPQQLLLQLPYKSEAVCKSESSRWSDHVSYAGMSKEDIKLARLKHTLNQLDAPRHVLDPCNTEINLSAQVFSS
ncbi:unnamed protein product, partial [Polarella glacialis]